MIEKVEW